VKLPRDISASRLIHVLGTLGYEVVRQKGSHIRMKHPGPPAHLVTIPNHSPLKTGTLHAILTEVSRVRSMRVESLTTLL
jgi:predicted RNA binding protein YcfA (HicA-like mRNA interferase family)